MRDLSQKDHDLLWGIYHFGGYCNSCIATLATGISRRKTFDHLNSLVERSYLCKVLIDFRRTTPHPVQVSGKTCRLFGNRRSYLRNNHPVDYITGALLKYLFPVEEPHNPKTESYKELLQRVTGTQRRPKNHLSLRDVNLRLIQTRTDVLSNSLQR